MKKPLTIVIILLLVTALLFIGYVTLNIQDYRTTDIKITDVSTTEGGEVKAELTNWKEYMDEQFGYSVQYPNDWRRENPTLAKGYVGFYPPNDKNFSVNFWYKDSTRMSNIDELVTFVEDDAKYAEQTEGVRTISITKGYLGQKNVVIWDSVDKADVPSKMYYFADFNPTDDQLIFVWIAWTSGTPASDTENETAKKILDSFKVFDASR